MNIHQNEKMRGLLKDRAVNKGTWGLSLVPQTMLSSSLYFFSPLLNSCLVFSPLFLFFSTKTTKILPRPFYQRAQVREASPGIDSGLAAKGSSHHDGHLATATVILAVLHFYITHLNSFDFYIKLSNCRISDFPSVCLMDLRYRNFHLAKSQTGK